MMANYTANYPALPALASNANDHPAAAVVAGTPLNDDDTSAAQLQLGYRKVLAETNLATVPEIQAAEKRALQISLENATGNAAAPAWAIAIQNQLTNVQNQMNNMQNQMNNLQNQMNNMGSQLQNLDIRQRNLNTDRPNHAIVPCRNAAGVIPPNFPQTRAALDSLDGPALSGLLNFYGLAVPHQVEERRTQLKAFLGVRL